MQMNLVRSVALRETKMLETVIIIVHLVVAIGVVGFVLIQVFQTEGHLLNYLQDMLVQLKEFRLRIFVQSQLYLIYSLLIKS